MTTSRSVAVDGVGYGPLATATEGLITNEQGVLRQLSGVASVETFGGVNTHLLLTQETIVDGDQFGANAIVQPLVQTIGLDNTHAFGASIASNAVAAGNLVTSETFGTLSASLGMSSTGLENENRLSVSNVALSLTQTSVQTSEAIGLGDITSRLASIGLTSAENFENVTTTVTFTTVGIESTQTVGSAEIVINGVTRNQDVGLASSTVVGEQQVVIKASTLGFESTTGVGALTTNVGVDSQGLATSELFGSAELAQTFYISQEAGVDSTENIGVSSTSIAVTTTGVSVVTDAGTNVVNVALDTAGYEQTDAFGLVEVVQFNSLEQNDGLSASNSFGDSQIGTVVSNSAFVDEDIAGVSSTTITLDGQGVRGYEYTRSFGTPAAEIGVNAGSLGSDASFGQQSTSIQINSIGLGDDTRIGKSYASYDVELTQARGLDDETYFGTSRVRGDEDAAEDYHNDAPDVIIKRRPLRFKSQRRVGSSSSSGASASASAVAVTVEMLTRSVTEGDGENRIKGRATKLVQRTDNIVVRARLIEANVVEDAKPSIVVTAFATPKTALHNSSAVIVRGERVFKVA